MEEHALLPVTERELEDLLRWHHRRAHLRLVTCPPPTSGDGQHGVPV
jgi:hypothetical protein